MKKVNPEECFIVLLGNLNDRFVTLPLEQDLTKLIERETSDFEEGDIVSEKNNMF